MFYEFSPVAAVAMVAAHNSGQDAGSDNHYLFQQVKPFFPDEVFFNFHAAQIGFLVLRRMGRGCLTDTLACGLARANPAQVPTLLAMAEAIFDAGSKPDEKESFLAGLKQQLPPVPVRDKGLADITPATLQPEEHRVLSDAFNQLGTYLRNSPEWAAGQGYLRGLEQLRAHQVSGNATHSEATLRAAWQGLENMHWSPQDHGVNPPDEVHKIRAVYITSGVEKQPRH